MFDKYVQKSFVFRNNGQTSVLDPYALTFFFMFTSQCPKPESEPTISVLWV